MKTKPPNRGPASERLAALLDEPEVVSWRAILESSRAVYACLESALQKDGCSISRFQILLHLYFDGPLAPTTIASRLRVTRGNISTFLKRMEKDELVCYEVPPGNKRRPLCELTAKGIGYFETLLPSHIDRVKKLVHGLSTDCIDNLNMIRKRVAEIELCKGSDP